MRPLPSAQPVNSSRIPAQSILQRSLEQNVECPAPTPSPETWSAQPQRTTTPREPQHPEYPPQNPGVPSPKYKSEHFWNAQPRVSPKNFWSVRPRVSPKNLSAQNQNPCSAQPQFFRESRSFKPTRTWFRRCCWKCTQLTRAWFRQCFGDVVTWFQRCLEEILHSRGSTLSLRVRLV